MNRNTTKYLSRLRPGAAIIAALVFIIPSPLHAETIPEKIIFQTGDFTQIVDRPSLEGWWSIVDRPAFHPEREPEIEAPYCPFLPLTCEAFFSRAIRTHFVIEHSAALNPDPLRSFITSLEEKVTRDPQNAKVAWDVLTSKLIVTTDGVSGRTLDIENTVAQASVLLSENTLASVTLPLVVIETAPKITRSSLTELGIQELLGVGTTNFKGSPKNRVYNIERSIQQFEGVLIAPGEEFSFVKYLGEVDGEHGYLPELVIKANKTEPEFGGGICQVSTTTFRAALNAGLKITARKNHAYPVQYYKPYGMDATVYIPYPDLRFQNNTPGNILIHPEITGTELSFFFYGTKDGRTITIDGPHILESNPDGSMRTTFTQTVTDANGAILVNDVFPSNYKSPSLFPHPGDDQIFTSKPAGWSEKQWRAYKKIHP